MPLGSLAPRSLSFNANSSPKQRFKSDPPEVGVAGEMIFVSASRTPGQGHGPFWLLLFSTQHPSLRPAAMAV